MSKYKDVKKIKEDEVEKSYVPTEKEQEVLDFVMERTSAMKEYRKDAFGDNIDEEWKKIDKEYLPKPTDEMSAGKHFEQNEETGLRSVLVPVAAATENWRVKNSDPILMTKILTAMSIIIDRDPEAAFSAVSKRFVGTNALAHAIWKSSWLIDKSKLQLKLFCFNLAKYGWAIGRTYPKILKREKSILTKYDSEDPTKNVYEKKIITDFNGVHRENLDVYKTWIDEMTRPFDQYSMNDWCFNKDYNYDSAKLEFGDYPNFQFVSKDSYLKDANEIEINRTDLVTIEFYENKNKDLYTIRVPSSNILLYSGPLPNDDGRLSCWQGPWLLKDVRNPYGLNIWDQIKQKKGLYDKMLNMTMDQLVLSIYKMFFFSGTGGIGGSNEVKIEPGKGIQTIGGEVKWLEIPGPGQESFDGLRYIKGGMDDDSGITPTLQGEVTGKTLGETLNAKEAALKRMNDPINNISNVLSDEAYISLSWLQQTLSTPEIKQFVSVEEMDLFDKENGKNPTQMESQNNPETGQLEGITASYLPEVSLNIEKDTLYETKDTRFLNIGTDIPVSSLRWEGIITVKPTSLLTPSEELEKQQTDELWNLTSPLFQFPPEIYAKGVKELYIKHNIDYDKWLPESWIQFLETGSTPQMEQQTEQQNQLFTDPAQEQLAGILGEIQGQKGGQGGQGGANVAAGETMKFGQNLTPPTNQTVVPKNEISGGATNRNPNGLGKIFNQN
jgi:hypothetical protein